MYPMSKDEITYERLIKILSLYRLTLGQARQEELLEYLFRECENPEELKKLFINLSPFSKEEAVYENEDLFQNDGQNPLERRKSEVEKPNGKNILIERAIQAYIDDFDKNNLRDGASLRNETIKWTAAATFAMNWDINTEDFLSMWKKCTKGAFIDTRHNHPTQGITILLKNPEEQDGVRNAFRNLFKEGVSDTEDKWSRIMAFMDYINGRINALYPNSTIYLQTKEGVLTYLNLWDPDHNYRYKPAPANNWASYIGYEDWESGHRFSLRKYYKMCDEIHEVVKNHEDLLRIHRQRFENGLPDFDKELHILTFDVLYCFWGYDDVRREALLEYEEGMRQQRIDELEEQLSLIDRQIKEKAGRIKEIGCSGLVVHHKSFGIGTVSEVSGNRIIIEFEMKGRKIFQYPNAIINGFLHFDDDTITGSFSQNEEIDREIAALQEQKKAVEEELSSTVSVGTEQSS